MFGKQMMALEARKQALLMESDLNRLRVRAEFNNLRESVNFSKRLSGLTSWRRVLPPLAAVVMTLGAGGSIFAGGLLRKVVVAGPAVAQLWRTFSALLANLR
jgi:hypothetical protein